MKDINQDLLKRKIKSIYFKLKRDLIIKKQKAKSKEKF